MHFLVYQVNEKPMSSIRNAQVQREALDDLNALTTLESVVGRERVVALIMENAEEPFDFEHYPHRADYIFATIERMAELFMGGQKKKTKFRVYNEKRKEYDILGFEQ